MSNELAIQNTKTRLPMPSGLTDIDAGKWRVLCESVFPSAKTPEAIVMALDYCRVRNLDPFKRPVNIVPMWNSTLQANVETVWPGINEVQITASRTGHYAGMDEPKWGPDKTRVFEGTRKWKEGNSWKEEHLKKEITYPEWCAVTVYRIVDGQRCAFTEPVYWEEAYARAGKTEVPNEMWSKRPRGQIIKVAKAFSLRAAFPEEGEYTAEEMEGKEISAGGVVIDHEEVKKPSLFKNASLRNAYCKAAIEAFEASKTVAELNEAFNGYLPKLKEMRDSGNEHDALGAEEIHRRYQQQLARIKDPTPAEDIGTFDHEEEEIPAFIRQEMQEQAATLRAREGR